MTKIYFSGRAYSLVPDSEIKDGSKACDNCVFKDNPVHLCAFEQYMFFDTNGNDRVTSCIAGKHHYERH